jgi:uncharacterized RDD family membrane protein YckC
MPAPESKQPEEDEPQRASLPSKLKPSQLLDSILSPDGPMPAARLPIRSLAFTLDFVLLTAVSIVVIWKLIMPIYHPGTYYEFTQWIETLLNWFQSEAQSDTSSAPQMSTTLTQGIRFAQDIQLIIFWVYFAIGEVFFTGSSLGKKICRLRTINTITLDPPSIMTGLVRAGLKTLAIFMLFPISIFITACVLFFNKRSQMGHDLLSRSVVIDERSI